MKTIFAGAWGRGNRHVSSQVNGKMGLLMTERQARND
jgi:hypothetical protein